MYTVESTGGAVACLVGGLLLLGLWPTCWAHVERRGRTPSHVFLDYGLSYMFITVAASMLLGSVGGAGGHAGHASGAPPAQGFFATLRAADARLAALALAGGAVLAGSDVLLQYGVAFLGVAVGPPIFCALSLLTSAVAAFYLDGRRNAARLLFPGVAAALAAIGLGVAAHYAGRAARMARAAEADAAAGAAGAAGVEGYGGSDGKAAATAAGAAEGEASDEEAGLAGYAAEASGGGCAAEDAGSAAAAARLCQVDSRSPLKAPGALDSAAVDVVVASPGRSCQPAEAPPLEAGIDALLPHPAHRVLQTPPTAAAAAAGSPPASPRSQGWGQQALGLPRTPAPMAPAPTDRAPLAPPPVAAGAAATEADATSSLAPAAAAAGGGGLRQRRNRAPPGPAAQQPPEARAIAAADSTAAGAAALGFAFVLPGALLSSSSYVMFVAAVKDAPGLLAHGPAGPGALGTYPAAALYSIGFGLAAVLVSGAAMYRPPLGTRPSSVGAWARDWRGRALCVLSGALTAGGDMLQFMGGDAAGYAAALLVQAHPLVGMAVSALALRELRGAGWRAASLVAAQAGAYAGSVALLAASAAVV